MRLYFVRHGESEANVLRIISNRGLRHGLTEKGRAQAEALAGCLAEFPIVSLFSSPVPRAVETAEIVAERLGLPYQIADALREYDRGVLEGRSDEEAWRLHREIAQDWQLRGNHQRRPTCGESFFDIRDRFVPFIEQLTRHDAHAIGDVALISHGGILRLMLPLVLTNVDAAFAERNGIGHTDCIIAERAPGGLRCVRWGALESDDLEHS